MLRNMEVVTNYTWNEGFESEATSDGLIFEDTVYVTRGGQTRKEKDEKYVIKYHLILSDSSSWASVYDAYTALLATGSVHAAVALAAAVASARELSQTEQRGSDANVIVIEKYIYQ